jgi:hypothetical protein
MVAIVAVRGVSGMQSAQTIAAAVFGLAGASIFAVGKYQKANHVIGKVPLLSARGKHAIGLVLLFLGVMIFLSQFVGSGTKRIRGKMAGAAVVTCLPSAQSCFYSWSSKTPILISELQDTT